MQLCWLGLVLQIELAELWVWDLSWQQVMGQRPWVQEQVEVLRLLDHRDHPQPPPAAARPGCRVHGSSQTRQIHSPELEINHLIIPSQFLQINLMYDENPPNYKLQLTF